MTFAPWFALKFFFLVVVFFFFFTSICIDLCFSVLINLSYLISQLSFSPSNIWVYRFFKYYLKYYFKYCFSGNANLILEFFPLLFQSKSVITSLCSFVNWMNVSVLCKKSCRVLHQVHLRQYSLLWT